MIYDKSGNGKVNPLLTHRALQGVQNQLPIVGAVDGHGVQRRAVVGELRGWAGAVDERRAGHVHVIRLLGERELRQHHQEKDQREDVHVQEEQPLEECEIRQHARAEVSCQREMHQFWLIDWLIDW